MFDDLPRLMPGTELISGQLKTVPEDFVVEEIPAYEPCGEGEHLFLWVQKRDCSADWLVRQLSRSLGVSQRDIGVAGLKDRWAVTRQWISVPARCVERLEQANNELIRVLQSKLHRNKLKTGHLRGNQFSILLRTGEIADAGWEHLAQRIERVQQVGFPNYFGSQRFGRDGETLKLGEALIRGTADPRDIPPPRRKFLLRLALSALQSELFNQTLAERMTAGDAQRVLPGDVLQVVESGGLFLSEDLAVEQERLVRGEIALTGPLFGPKMKMPEGEVAVREAQILADANLEPSHFERHAQLTQGTRRPFFIRPKNLSATREAEGIRFEFTLPSGVYATTLMRELVEFTEGAVPQDEASETEAPTEQT